MLESISSLRHWRYQRFGEEGHEKIGTPLESNALMISGGGCLAPLGKGGAEGLGVGSNLIPGGSFISLHFV